MLSFYLKVLENMFVIFWREEKMLLKNENKNMVSNGNKM